MSNKSIDQIFLIGSNGEYYTGYQCFVKNGKAARVYKTKGAASRQIKNCRKELQEQYDKYHMMWNQTDIMTANAHMKQWEDAEIIECSVMIQSYHKVT